MKLKFNQPVIVPIEDILPYDNNAKTHPPEQIDKLAKQIKDGFDQPIVVDKSYVIIKGHGRLLAAKKLGLTQVPVIIRGDLSPEQIKAARIADNKLAETDWDLDILSNELTALVENFNLEDLGFNEEELNKLLSPDDFNIDEDDKNDDESNNISNNHSNWVTLTLKIPSEAMERIQDAYNLIEQERDGLNNDKPIAWGQVLESLAADYLAGN